MGKKKDLREEIGVLEEEIARLESLANEAQFVNLQAAHLLKHGNLDDFQYTVDDMQ